MDRVVDMAVVAVVLLAVILMVVVVGVITLALYVCNRVRGTYSAHRVASKRGWAVILSTGIATFALTILVSAPT